MAIDYKNKTDPLKKRKSTTEKKKLFSNNSQFETTKNDPNLSNKILPCSFLVKKKILTFENKKFHIYKKESLCHLFKFKKNWNGSTI